LHSGKIQPENPLSDGERKSMPDHSGATKSEN